MSELIRWFQRRRETLALKNIQRHLSITTEIVDDLDKAVSAALKEEEKEMQKIIQRITLGEREADALRRKVIDEISNGELPPTDRVDLMDLVKRVDMVADWSREATRILRALPMKRVPESIKEEFSEMSRSVKECAASLQQCVNKMMTKPEEALQAADMVEREEEKIDDVHEKARMLLGTENLTQAGVAILISELFEAIEMIADACEDACDQVRVIMVRR
ncbi:MAG: DUF47 family protein [Candidatus Bathyarchaeota archaeon]|nr:DUF47 family protein [Candidatus Bathyarchaeota archaeon]